MGQRFSILTLLCMIISIVGSPTIIAQSNDSEHDKPDSFAAREKNQNQPSIIKEIIEERGENYKKYLLSNGSYKLEIHESIIHYKDESGQYQDINTNLVDESNIPDAGVTVSKEAAAMKNNIKSMKMNKKSSSFTSFHVPFYSEIPKQIVKGYSIQSNGEKLTFIPVGASENSVGQIDSTAKSKIKYQNVWLNTDVELQILNDGIKENIILKNEYSPKSFTFEVTGNLASNKLYIQPPWLMDANGVTRDVKLSERIEGSKKYVDYEWDGDGLAYPVVIDPIVSIQSTSFGCVTKLNYSGNCTSDLKLSYRHREGTSKIYGDIYSSFVKFNIPNIPGAVNINAALTLSQSPSTEFQGNSAPTITVKSYAVTGLWPANWNETRWPGPAVYQSEETTGFKNVMLFNTGTAQSVQFDVTGIYNYFLNKGSSTMEVALIPTDLIIPPYLTIKEYSLTFSNPTLELTYQDLENPTKPRNLKVTALTNNSVSLSWEASVDNSNTVYYQIIRNGSVSTTHNTNSYTASGLAQNTKYTFSIRAVDPSNNLSLESNPVTITTGIRKPIANFLNLSENESYLNPISMKWSYFDPTGKKLTAYEIKGSNDNWATTGFNSGVLPVTTPVDFSTNLISSKPWSLAIRAYNESGAGDWSYISNIMINGNLQYIYNSAGRIDYIILDGKLKLKYEYDLNGNLIRTVKTTL